MPRQSAFSLKSLVVLFYLSFWRHVWKFRENSVQKIVTRKVSIISVRVWWQEHPFILSIAHQSEGPVIISNITSHPHEKNGRDRNKEAHFAEKMRHVFASKILKISDATHVAIYVNTRCRCAKNKSMNWVWRHILHDFMEDWEYKTHRLDQTMMETNIISGRRFHFGHVS